MSFSPVGPFSFGSKLTSAQANQWDANIVNALDKSVAGDTLAGIITFSGAGAINANLGDTIIVSAAGAMQVIAAGAIVVVTGGSVFVTGTGQILSKTAAGIATNTAGGITSSVANGIASGADGGIALSGSAGDWIQYTGTTRDSVFFCRAKPATVASGWTYSEDPASGLVGPATTQVQYFTLDKMYNGLITGATLSTVTLLMSVGTSHAGAPVVPPSFSVQRTAIFGVGSLVPTSQSLLSTGSVSFPSAGSGALWYDGGHLKSLTMTCDQNNGIATNNYFYSVGIVDENGTNALADNIFWGVLLHFTGITNSAPSY